MTKTLKNNGGKPVMSVCVIDEVGFNPKDLTEEQKERFKEIITSVRPKGFAGTYSIKNKN